MNSFLNYLLQSALAVTVLYVVFRLLFERLANFKFNRFFLLGSVVFALVIPLLHIPVATNSGSNAVVGASGFYQLPEVTLSAAAPGFSATQIWFSIYGFGVLLLALRLLRQLFRISKLKKNSLHTEHYQNYTLVYTEQQNPAFTFGRTIFLSNTGNFSPAEKEVILAHELVHVNQRHTLDILLLEAVIILQWFNPVVWLLKNSLRDQHEFLADQAGVKAAPDFNFYTRQIIGQVLNVSPFALTHNFSSSQLKKRIIMMQQKTTLRKALTRAACAFPVAGILFYAIACDGAKQEIKPTQTEKTEASANAQKNEEQPDVMPSFKENEMAFYTYMAENIRIPEINKAQEGKVFAEFVIDAAGKVTEVHVLKGMGAPFDLEVVRVLANMPAWTPALKNGKPVSMKMVVPVAFKGQDGSSASTNTRKKDATFFKGFESTIATGC